MEYKNHIPVPPFEVEKVLEFFEKKKLEQSGSKKGDGFRT